MFNYINYIYQPDAAYATGTRVTLGTLTVEFSKDVTSWTIEVTFEADVKVLAISPANKANCSGSTCTFDDWNNGEQSAGNTIEFTFWYDTPTIITEVSITSESTPFCTS